jgi:diacylglycerol kinase (ATP)
LLIVHVPSEKPAVPRGEPFSLRARARSFVYAFRGLRRFFSTEHNAWIHLVAAALALVLSILLKISAIQWVGVLFAIGAVLTAEAFNTCVEKMMDKLIPETSETVRYVKDLAAGAVLLSALVAAVIGGIIFIPLIIQLF